VLPIGYTQSRLTAFAACRARGTKKIGNADQSKRRINQSGGVMAQKYSEAASKIVERAMHERKRGTLKSGRSGNKVKSRKQAIAIGLSEARRAGKTVPKR
jgi:hypothetical protein